MTWILAALLCIVLVEVVARMPVVQVAADASAAAGRAFRTMSAPGISDHWKEKALLAYSKRLFGATLRLVGLLLIVVVLVGVLLFLGGLITPGLTGFMMSWIGILFTLVFATAYYMVRKPGKSAAGAEGSAYGAMDRTLHRLALKNATLAEMLFDMGVAKAKPDLAEVAAGQHVFVSGLARAGTTVLMRRFHGSGAFRSLTYRDMPYVLAPNIGAKLMGGGKRDIEAHERAHGDGIIVDADSPESFDEAFWRVFDGSSYIRPDCLVPHHPDAELTENFCKYVGVVMSTEGKTRYLSKNNNNILRLPELAQTFPEALILVPFRDPLSHAASLRNQHLRFLESQAKDPFEIEYMGYLGHHEFGRDHRPFRMTETPAAPEAAPDSLDYWLGLWIDVYGYLDETLPDTARLVCYEALCEDPAVWAGLAAEAGLEVGPTDEPFVVRRREPDEPVDPALRARAEALYETLRARAGVALASPAPA